jgi:hypothetical protein
MKKLYTFFALIAPTFLLVSFSNNPPDGMTGAPGDSLCIECHVQSNPPINGTISLEGFPASITPNQTYLLTVVNRNTVGDAVRAGFQMTILGSLNTKAGEMSMASASAKVTNAGGRQYFEHNPAVEYPDSNVVKWTVEWTAPDLPGGSQITWYAAGNVTNGNFQNTGDRVVTANGTGSIVLSSTDDPLSQQKPTLYPNPGSDQINIILADQSKPNGNAVFYTLLGTRVNEADIQEGRVIVPGMPAGIYLVEINDGVSTYFVKWSKL